MPKQLLLVFHHVGPARPQSIPLPPPSTHVLHANSVLVYDEAKRRAVYAFDPGYHGFGVAWTWDGAAWTEWSPKHVQVESPEESWQGFWDAGRGGVAAWNIHDDYEHEIKVPVGVLIDEGGSRKIETSGDMPVFPERDYDWQGDFAAFAPDPVRGVTLCLTQKGLWSLDGKGVWAKAAEAPASMPAKLEKHMAGGAWDAKGKRAVLHVADDDGNRHLFYGWDGTALTEIPTQGLPESVAEPKGGFDKRGLPMCTHPELGLVLLAPSEGLFALGDGAWSMIPGSEDGVPHAALKARFCYDAARETFMVGPGYYGTAPEEHPDEQHVFYLWKKGQAWTRQGVVKAESPIKVLYHDRLFAHWKGTLYGVASYYLQTFAWTNEGWVEVVGKDASKDVFSGGTNSAGTHFNISALVVRGEELVALGSLGEIFAFDGKKWSISGKPARAVYKVRPQEIIAAWDPAGARLVSWGGVNGKKGNDLLFHDGKKWKQAGPQPKPKDFAHHAKSTGVYVTQTALWDAALGRVVRFGWEECAILQGDTWLPRTPVGYKKLVHPRGDHRFAAHDPRTGETLLVNAESRRVVRFDLKRCEEVAAFEWPAEVTDDPKNPDQAWRQLIEAVSFDPGTRTLHFQRPEDNWGRWGLDLGPAFDAAAALGPRTQAPELATKKKPGSKPPKGSKSKPGNRRRKS